MSVVHHHRIASRGSNDHRIATEGGTAEQNLREYHDCNAFFN